MSGTIEYYGISNYSVNKIQVGSNTDWTAISGYSIPSAMGYCYAFGIRAGRLYSLCGTTATQLGSATNWTAVTGFAYYETTENGYKMSIAYGIAGGALYKIYLSDNSLVVEQVGSATDWQSISGYSYLIHFNDGYGFDTTGSAFGIRGGVIYELYGATTIDEGTLWYFVVMESPNSGIALTRSEGSGSYY